MSGKYFDPIDHAILSMNYYGTKIQIDEEKNGLNRKKVLNELKRDVKIYESAIRKIEDRNNSFKKKEI